jgi:hypothetical protein
LLNLICDQGELLLSHSAYIDFDMKTIVDSEFRANASGEDSKILKALDYGADGREISVGDDSKLKQGDRLVWIHGRHSA